MLTSIVRFSLAFRGVVIALACALVGYGLYSLSRATYDVFPEFAPPQVVIQDDAPGLAPEQVETLVTQPIENAVHGVPGIEALRSSSIQGLSLITVTFNPGSNIYQARQVVAERLATLTNQFPHGVSPPVMTPLTSSTSVVLALGLTSEKLWLLELRTLVDWTVRQRLLAVPFALVGGVLAVFAFGGILSLGAIVSFVTLFGITLRNSIMLISHYEHLVAVEGQPWNLDTALRGAGGRLAPILMTALVTALGLLPLSIGTGDPGREIEGPMAIVILGGLLSSTALNLLVLPALALRFGRFDSHAESRDDREQK